MRTKDEQKILALKKAVLDQVFKTGFKGLQLKTITQGAGIAIGTFYIYYENKETLLAEMYEELAKGSIARVMKGYSLEIPFDVGFQRVWYNMIMQRVEYPKENHFLDLFKKTADFRHIWGEKDKEIFTLYFQLLARGMAEEYFLPIPIELIIAQFKGNTYEVAELVRLELVPKEPEIMNQAFLMLWNSITRSEHQRAIVQE